MTYVPAQEITRRLAALSLPLRPPDGRRGTGAVALSRRGTGARRRPRRPGSSPARRRRGCRGRRCEGQGRRTRTYRTADGRHVALGAIEAKFWRAFCEAAGRDDWIERRGEPEPQRALIAEVEAFFAARSLADLADLLATGDCCATAVLTLGEALESAQMTARGLVRRGEGDVLDALFPARIDGEPPTARRAVVEAALPRWR